MEINKVISLIVIFFMALFSVNLEVDAKASNYRFPIDSSADVTDPFYKGLCVGDGKTCMLICKRDEQVFSTAIGGGGLNVCDEFGGVKYFYTHSETLEDLKNTLENSQCGDNGVNCFEYFEKDYCLDWKSKDVTCLQMKNYLDSGEDTSKLPGNEVGEDIDIFSCDELLESEGGEELIDLVKMVVTLFKFLVPIILFAVSVLDFGKAILGGEDDMKKAQKKFIKRIIIAVVIFLIPSLLTFVLRTASLIWSNIDYSLCGILE